MGKAGCKSEVGSGVNVTGVSGGASSEPGVAAPAGGAAAAAELCKRASCPAGCDRTWEIGVGMFSTTGMLCAGPRGWSKSKPPGPQGHLDGVSKLVRMHRAGQSWQKAPARGLWRRLPVGASGSTQAWVILTCRQQKQRQEQRAPQQGEPEEQ